MAAVFTNATRFGIQESTSLDILMLVRHRFKRTPGSMGLPSWVPAFGRRFDPELDAGAMPRFFCASFGLPVSYLDDQAGDNNISLSGLYVDEIDDSRIRSLSRCCRQAGDLVGFFRNSTEMLATAQADVTRSTDNSALAMTLTAGCSYHGEQTSEQDVLDFEDFSKCLAEDNRVPDSDRGPSKNAANRYADAFWDAACCRRFFITTSGRIGLGPQTMRVNDIVVVLHGGKWPFVLRPKGDVYKFIGHCYVHGIMYGEAVQKHKAEGGEDVVFCLV